MDSKNGDDNGNDVGKDDDERAQETWRGIGKGGIRRISSLNCWKLS